MLDFTIFRIDNIVGHCCNMLITIDNKNTLCFFCSDNSYGTKEKRLLPKTTKYCTPTALCIKHSRLHLLRKLLYNRCYTCYCAAFI
jgi:hypothetical protein